MFFSCVGVHHSDILLLLRFVLFTKKIKKLLEHVVLSAFDDGILGCLAS